MKGADTGRVRKEPAVPQLRRRRARGGPLNTTGTVITPAMITATATDHRDPPDPNRPN